MLLNLKIGLLLKVFTFAVAGRALVAKHYGSLELQLEKICPPNLILLQGVTYDWEHLICNNMEFDSVKHLQLFLPRQLTAVYASVGANSFARYLENGRGTRTTPITPLWAD